MARPRSLALLVLAVALAIPATAAAARPAATPTTPAQAAARAAGVGTPPTLSITDRLDDRRYVAAGARAYSVGTEAGRFPAMGWHTRGEMGGIWSPPIKLLDGVWFGVGDSWIGPATRFTSGWGYVQMDLPGSDALRVTRTEFVPDGHRALLIGLTLTAPSAAQRVPLKVDAHSELMGVYPWGETTPSQLTYNLPDSAAFDGRDLVFRERGTPPVANALPHDWAALVGSALTPSGHETGADFRGPEDPPVICPASGPNTPTPPLRCDDTAYGKGAGGELRYDVQVPGGGSRTVWFAVSGSDQGPAAAAAEQAAVLANPFGLLVRKVLGRFALAARSHLDLPGDPQLAAAVDWGKQNLADLTQEARDLRVRFVNQGKDYPPPVGTVPRIRFEGAGFPDYPWLFATDGEYTAFALVASGQFSVVRDHLRALRAVSELVNGDSGKVVHEVATDGSVYFGANSDPGNTDETVKFPSTVALYWRWTGDDRFRDEMYPFVKKNLAYVFAHLDADHDLWPEGSGNVEQAGLGDEKLDVAVYTIRGLYDLADMAASKGDAATVRWALDRARPMVAKFERDWWMPAIPQHADSLVNPDNTQTQQRYWIGVTPMEAELYRGTQPVPGLTTAEHGALALALRETDCYTGPNGLYVQGGTGCDPAPPPVVGPNQASFSLNTAVQAVGEGNYGRLAEQRVYTTDNAKQMLPNPDEQPGALPEILPSPNFIRNIDQPFYARSMLMQAWGQYGLVWPVVHQQLGVRPDLGNGRLEVTPQVPPGAPYVAGSDIRVGGGAVAVRAEVAGSRYLTTVQLHLATRLLIGHTLPADATVGAVLLNGSPVSYQVRTTHRGKEVVVDAGVHAAGTFRLEVRTA